MRSMAASRSLAALTRALSAGPWERTSGLIMDGFMGRVEFGSRTGSQFPAGRSYQGVEGSPCMAGMTHGAVLAAFAMALAELSATFSAFSCPTDVGPSSTADRSFGMKPSEKYPFSSHRATRSCSLRICLGLFLKEAAVLMRAGRDGSSFWAKASSRRRNLAWYKMSLSR